MIISRLMPFLSLLLLLPATPDAAIVIPHNESGFKPGDLCPLTQIVEHELCVGQQQVAQHNNASALCVLLQEYNASFCSDEKEHSDTKPISYDVMSVHVLENEFHNSSQNELHGHVPDPVDDANTNHAVCPIINFIEQELCTSRNEELHIEFDPKELCPILNLTYTELCS